MKKLRTAFDPYEWLYICISIATFSHSVWSSSTIFEGIKPETEDFLWYFKGVLLAIAIDVGMFVTSKSLTKSRSRKSTLILVAAFTIAATASFLTQLFYLLSHTSEYHVTDGVSDYWYQLLKPITDARVIIFPLLLPVLAIVYTLARITNHPKTISAKGSHPIESSKSQEIIIEQELPLLTEKSGYQVDWTGLKLWDPKYSYWRQYPNRDKMEKSIARLEKTRGVKIDV